jgi:hypothetical protein
VKTTESLIKILKSNTTEAEERSINRLRTTIENLQDELHFREKRLDKLKRGIQPENDPMMQVTEQALITA